MLVINKINTRLNVANWLAPRQRRQKKGLVNGKNSFNVSIGLASVQVTYAFFTTGDPQGSCQSAEQGDC
jgi:hypothetical protein